MARKSVLLSVLFLTLVSDCFCWGFFAHRKINYYAVFLLPPEMMILYKSNLAYLFEHAVDPDKRRYMIENEGPRHYFDYDLYTVNPKDSIPKTWKKALEKWPADTLMYRGIAPWWIQIMLYRLSEAFREKDKKRILKLSAEMGHYVSDIHVPLHAHSNHNGQYTGQRGIHGFWESRIPELVAETQYDFFIGKAFYLKDPATFVWERVKESYRAADTVLKMEKELTGLFPPDRKYAFEERNGKILRQYAADFCLAYEQKLNGMIERRMRASILAVASIWYTAWVNAGQPRLDQLTETPLNEAEIHEMEELNLHWQKDSIKGWSCDE